MAPLTLTIEPGTKLLPVRVSVNPALPAVVLAGDMLASAGTGLLTVKVRAALVPPPEPALLTVIASDPAVARSLAASDAVN